MHGYLAGHRRTHGTHNPFQIYPTDSLPPSHRLGNRHARAHRHNRRLPPGAHRVQPRVALGLLRRRAPRGRTSLRLPCYDQLHCVPNLRGRTAAAVYDVLHGRGRDQCGVLCRRRGDAGGVEEEWENLGGGAEWVYAGYACGARGAEEDACCLGGCVFFCFFLFLFVAAVSRYWCYESYYAIEMVLEHNVTLSDNTIVMYDSSYSIGFSKLIRGST